MSITRTGCYPNISNSNVHAIKNQNKDHKMVTAPLSTRLIVFHRLILSNMLILRVWHAGTQFHDREKETDGGVILQLSNCFIYDTIQLKLEQYSSKDQIVSYMTLSSHLRSSTKDYSEYSNRILMTSHDFFQGTKITWWL